ncbi:ABC transporter substrate-binding protein [Actinocorallia longicatena]|uniref:Leucine-binding protein domain-containing protein n=1 Tax=Actinocorallia longicatena TaxID=111803 RepID=A0ABP6Q4Q9_9ACTN
MKPRAIPAALVAVALLLTACSGRSGDGEESPPAATVASGDFGDLKSVCKPGQATGTPAQGVTASEIKIGVLTDRGFTQNSELVNAAKVFTDWCNAAGGINGRKISYVVRDTKLMEVRQRVLEACREDFVLAGGSAALDGMGVKDRLNCLLPDFPAQVVQLENVGSDLQVYVGGESAKYDPYQGYYKYLFEAYPDSKGAVGVLNGDSPITKVLGERTRQGVPARGGTIIYDDKYPIQGVADWTPYAVAIKNKGVKGLQFYGQWALLAKLEQKLTDLNYKLDWIDANSNAYGFEFINALGKAASFQNNVADLSGFAPLESSATNPAIKQLQEMYDKANLSGKATFPAIGAFSSWLLFAKAAGSCGDALTRKCVYDAARAEKSWTGGGLQAPADLTTPGAPRCFNVEQATADGWKPADFKPDSGAFRCDAPALELKGPAFPKPVTLKDVGKSLADVK